MTRSIQFLLVAALTASLAPGCERDSASEDEDKGEPTEKVAPADTDEVSVIDAKIDAQTPPCAKPDDADDVLSACKASCDEKDDMVACVGLARAYMLRADKGAPSPGEPLRRACGEGLAEGCTALGDWLFVGGKPTEALGFWKKGCVMKHAFGCQRAGFELESGKKVVADLGAAADLYERACSMGLDLGCVSSGFAMRSGYGKDPDPKGAFERFSKACGGGDPMGCTFQGIMLYEGEGGITKDVAAAKPLLVKGCKVDARACAHLAAIHFEAKEDDLGGAAAIAACEKGSSAACGSLVERTEPACERKSKTACYALATLLDRAVALEDPARPKINARRNEVLERACEYGSSPSCADLGLFYERGFYGVRKSARRSKSFYARACELGHVPTCEKIGKPVPGAKEKK